MTRSMTRSVTRSMTRRMTRSVTRSQGMRRLARALGAVVLLLSPVAAAQPQGDEAAHAASGATPVIQVLSANVQGKNVYIPSTIVVEEGRPHVLSIFNATDTPHGFAIADLGIEVVLPVGEEVQVPLPALEGGKTHQIHCQLHAPHRNATLAVLDD